MDDVGGKNNNNNGSNSNESETIRSTVDLESFLQFEKCCTRTRNMRQIVSSANNNKNEVFGKKSNILFALRSANSIEINQRFYETMAEKL